MEMAERGAMHRWGLSGSIISTLTMASLKSQQDQHISVCDSDKLIIHFVSCYTDRLEAVIAFLNRIIRPSLMRDDEVYVSLSPCDAPNRI